MILPAVIRECYAAQSHVLAEVLSPIVPGLKGEPGEARAAAAGVEKWLRGVGITHKLRDEGFSDADIDRLCKLARETPSLGLLLSVAPVASNDSRIECIYRNSLQPME